MLLSNTPTTCTHSSLGAQRVQPESQWKPLALSKSSAKPFHPKCGTVELQVVPPRKRRRIDPFLIKKGIRLSGISARFSYGFTHASMENGPVTFNEGLSKTSKKSEYESNSAAPPTFPLAINDTPVDDKSFACA